MDIYQEKSNWKIYLAIMAVLILSASLLYTSYIANNLAVEEYKKVKQVVMATKTVQQDSIPIPDEVYTFLSEILISNTTIPMIVVEETGVIQGGRNYSEEKDVDIDGFLKNRLEKIKASGYEPIEGGLGNLVYYEDSYLLKMLTYFPFIQLGLISAFIAFGYYSFSTARESEQNQVWVGMAKETAHQLGTPISAILGWIEHLRMLHEKDEETQEVLVELNNDVSRLNLVADRFSKIGAVPELKETNIYEEIENMRAYMERRAPRRVEFDFPGNEHSPLNVNINPPLFNWVVENLLRNALDAMGGKGKISAQIHEEKEVVCINISDTGKGIPSSKFKTVFQPGFSTKKRGWGLGLSLAKRIIESYHSGKIFVKSSTLDQGTTFTIKLPKSK